MVGSASESVVVEGREASPILLQPRRLSRRRAAESARVSTDLRNVAEELGSLAEKLR